MYEMVYLTCALAGGTLLVCQFLLGLLGLGDHHDAVGDHDVHDAGGHDAHGHGDHDSHNSWFVGALFGVAYLMRSLHRLKADGTVRIERAVGQNGTVYLTIPAQKAGVGKVTLSLQNRTVEYQAVTPHQQLPTGSKIVVTAVLGPDTVEVVPAR